MKILKLKSCNYFFIFVFEDLWRFKYIVLIDFFNFVFLEFFGVVFVMFLDFFFLELLLLGIILFFFLELSFELLFEVFVFS